MWVTHTCQDGHHIGQVIPLLDVTQPNSFLGMGRNVCVEPVGYQDAQITLKSFQVRTLDAGRRCGECLDSERRSVVWSWSHYDVDGQVPHTSYR